MKVNVSVEATAREMREFFGLPDVKPFQDQMMQVMGDQVRQGMPPGFDYASLMRPFFPFQAEGMEAMQKAFWNAFSQGFQRHDTEASHDAAPPAQSST